MGLEPGMVDDPDTELVARAGHGDRAAAHDVISGFRSASISQARDTSIFFEHASPARLRLNCIRLLGRFVARKSGLPRCGCSAVEDRMRRFAQIALLACLPLLAGAAFALTPVVA